MKNLVISISFLMSMLFGAHVVADEATKEKEQPEGEVEEAKASVNLHETNVDGFLIDSITNIIGKLLSKSGVPADHAMEVGKQAASEIAEGMKAGNSLKFDEATVNSFFLPEVAGIVGKLLSKGGVPSEHAAEVGKQAAEEIAKAAKEGGNSLKLDEANVNSFFLPEVAGIVGKLLSKGGVPSEHAAEVGKQAAEEIAKAAKEGGNSLKYDEANVNSFFLPEVAGIVGKLLSKGGVPSEHAAEVGKQAAEEIAKAAGGKMPE